MKFRAGIVILLVISLAGYAGAKYYLHSKVKSKLDGLVRMASPFAQISYGGISSDLRGKLQIDTVGLNTPEGLFLQIGSIELQGPGPRFLWNLSGGFNNSELPDRLILKLNGLSVPADQGFGANFGAIDPAAENDSPDRLQPCTLAGFLTHTGLEQIGMEYLVMSSVMGYRFIETSGEAEVFLDYYLKDVESMSLAMSLRGIPGPDAVVNGVVPSLAYIELSYSLQPGHIQSMVGHCAQQVQQSSEQFLNSIFDQSDSQFTDSLGFSPGPGIKQMLRSLVTRGGTVQLTANPANDLDPSTLSAYKPEDIMHLLNVAVSFDDKPVKDLSFTFAADGASPSGPFAESGFGGNRDSAPANGEKSAGTRKERPRMRYIETRIGDLHRYIGSRVRLYTVNSGKPKKGLLTKYRADKFSVEQGIHGGKMTAHVRASEISKAEVLRLATEE